MSRIILRVIYSLPLMNLWRDFVKKRITLKAHIFWSNTYVMFRRFSCTTKKNLALFNMRPITYNHTHVFILTLRLVILPSVGRIFMQYSKLWTAPFGNTSQRPHHASHSVSSEYFELATEIYGRGVCLRGIFFAGITIRTHCNVITHKQCCVFDPQKHLANEIKEMRVFIGIRQTETYWSSPDPVLLVCWICYCKRNIEILLFFLLKDMIPS